MKIKKLMESFDAFINNDLETAKQLYREYFIESAQAIKAELDEQVEEELDESVEGEEEEVVEESFGGDPEADLYGEVMAEGDDPFASDEESAPADEFGADEEVSDAELPTADEWQEIQAEFDQLQALFDELGSGESDEGDLEFDSEPAEDEVVFGDEEEDKEEVKESFQMKAVKDPGMKSETEVDQSINKAILPKTAPKSLTGADPKNGFAKDGKVTGSSTKLDTSSAESYTTDDHNNVESSGKKIYTKSSQKGAASKETQADKGVKPITKSLRK